MMEFVSAERETIPPHCSRGLPDFPPSPQPPRRDCFESMNWSFWTRKIYLAAAELTATNQSISGSPRDNRDAF